jgi:hypothetical protein
VTVLFVVLSLLVVLAVVAIAVWLWLFLDLVDQAMELVRITVEERMALLRIAAISRIAELEQRIVRAKHRPPPAKDR